MIHPRLPRVDLSRYENPPGLDVGAGLLKRMLWHVVNSLVLQNSLNASSILKIGAMRAFGARIGKGVVVKPGINVKSPWFLEIADYAWIGERTWIDSLARVSIGVSACLSQDVYLCCGNHDWTDPLFGKTVKPIIVEDGAWIAARATLIGGITVGTHAVVSAGSLLAKDALPYTIYTGVPAVAVKSGS